MYKLEKEKIEKCVEVLQENPNVGLVATGYKIIYEEENRIKTQMPRSYPNHCRFLFMLMACISVQGAVMVRKSCRCEERSNHRRLISDGHPGRGLRDVAKN
jgi:hypothetical protein